MSNAESIISQMHGQRYTPMEGQHIQEVLDAATSHDYVPLGRHIHEPSAISLSGKHTTCKTCGQTA